MTFLKKLESEAAESRNSNEIDKSCCFVFMGPCIVRYESGIYNQQDAKNSQSLLLAVLYMFRAFFAHHQEPGTVCAAI
jgi:hypothetical protein